MSSETVLVDCKVHGSAVPGFVLSIRGKLKKECSLEIEAHVCRKCFNALIVASEVKTVTREGGSTDGTSKGTEAA